MKNLLVSPLYSEISDDPYNRYQARKQAFQAKVNVMVSDIMKPYVTKTPKKVTKRRLRRMGVAVK